MNINNYKILHTIAVGITLLRGAASVNDSGVEEVGGGDEGRGGEDVFVSIFLCENNLA